MLNPPLELKAHYLDEAGEKEVRKAFTKKDAQPKILIVTEKLRLPPFPTISGTSSRHPRCGRSYT